MAYWLQVGLITVGFAALYPFLRSLPDTECAFLHYQYVGETDGETEFCSSDSAVFLDLTRLQYPVDMTLVANREPAVGKKSRFTLIMKTTSGRPIAIDDLAVVHTRKMHLFVVDPSLSDYHHIHPEPTGEPGFYTFSLTPNRAGVYKIFAEVVPFVSAAVVVGQSSFVVPGESDIPAAGNTYESVVGDYRFEINFAAGVPVLNKDNDIRLKISHVANGSPVPFETVMGAYAHTVAFDVARKGYAHMHPLDGGTGLDTAHPRFGFSLNTDVPGQYKVWAQVRIAGEDIFAPFDVIVQ